MEDTFMGTIHWKEYFKRGLKRGINPRPVKGMLLTEVDDSGDVLYQGLAIETRYVERGKKDEGAQVYHVIYDADYVKEELLHLFNGLGLIKNGKVDTIQWEKWFSPTGELTEYLNSAATRQLEEYEEKRAEEFVANYPNTTKEFWLETFRNARKEQVEESTQKTTTRAKKA